MMVNSAHRLLLSTTKQGVFVRLFVCLFACPDLQVWSKMVKQWRWDRRADTTKYIISPLRDRQSIVIYIAGISDTFCLCYYSLCVLYTLAYVWGNDPVISCLHIDFFMECRPHIHHPTHCTQNVGTFVEQLSDFSCVYSNCRLSLSPSFVDILLRPTIVFLIL